MVGQTWNPNRIKPMTPTASIPLIDLNDADERIIPELARALCDTGFVLVAGHGIAEALVSDLRHQTVKYFARPLSEKLADSITAENYRGYIPLGFFSPNASLRIRRPLRINMRGTSSMSRSLPIVPFVQPVISTDLTDGRLMVPRLKRQ